MSAQAPRTLFDKIWDAHVVDRLPNGTVLLYIDLHLTHEVTTPQAFEGLRAAGPQGAPPGATLAVVDHNIATTRAAAPASSDERAASRSRRWSATSSEFGVPYIPLLDDRQGIVHIIGPELGRSSPA